ncbi:hypothetical protein FRUB_00023 [Fimbriiglobus ruber]|uniref:Uncharacterized protein n=2 Tax=Fimbriiglobus ruber TaxID=1908690 RepID=A0A225E3J2_9BACT|nr:hypothetical protein FRUB_00023 [Fimbriiglobus ruber]
MFKSILAQMPAEGGFALLTDPDPSANAQMVWYPSNVEPQATIDENSDGSRVTGGFVAFLYGPEIPEGARLQEDGFVLMFPSASWQRTKNTLEAGNAVDIWPGNPAAMPFRIEWYE